MLNDLTLEIWVPSFRWSEAHRIQRKTPSYYPHQVSVLPLQVSVAGYLDSRSSWPILLSTVSESLTSTSVRNQRRAWVPGTAVCTSVITRYGLDQLLKSPLVPRLMALAQCRGHGVM